MLQEEEEKTDESPAAPTVVSVLSTVDNPNKKKQVQKWYNYEQKYFDHKNTLINNTLFFGYNSLRFETKDHIIPFKLILEFRGRTNLFFDFKPLLPVLCVAYVHIQELSSYLVFVALDREHFKVRHHRMGTQLKEAIVLRITKENNIVLNQEYICTDVMIGDFTTHKKGNGPIEFSFENMIGIGRFTDVFFREHNPDLKFEYIQYTEQIDKKHNCIIL